MSASAEDPEAARRHPRRHPVGALYSGRSRHQHDGGNYSSADIQRRLADQLKWVNVTGCLFYQAYRKRVRDYSFDDQAYFFLEKTWLEK
jgi:hypothetical protein